MPSRTKASCRNGTCYGTLTAPRKTFPRSLTSFRPARRPEYRRDELWSRVCHQGTAYSASFAVLPYLLEAASKWQPSQRLMPLALAAAIVASWDVEGSRDQLIA